MIVVKTNSVCGTEDFRLCPVDPGGTGGAANSMEPLRAVAARACRMSPMRAVDKDPDDPRPFALAREAMLAGEATAKLDACQRAVSAWRAVATGKGVALPAAGPSVVAEVLNPGYPAELVLVAPRELVARKPHTPEGHAALIHAICHIEFSAINLAWDAVFRFRAMPAAYYQDWVQVAEEEARHFGLLAARLADLGYHYGQFPAHNGLWEMARETAYDPLVRMALVPRVLEARGLDVTPGIMARLADIGDEASVAILEIIHHDEIGHVETGTRWFHYLCEQRGLDAEATFRQLLEKHMRGAATAGPLHREARRQAGFSEAELDYLEGVGR